MKAFVRFVINSLYYTAVAPFVILWFLFYIIGIVIYMPNVIINWAYSDKTFKECFMEEFNLIHPGEQLLQDLEAGSSYEDMWEIHYDKTDIN